MFLKSERCSSPKCVTVRRPYKPGEHGKKRSRPLSEYGRELQEKQKVQLVYGLNNRQMGNLFKETKEKIFMTLEMRLDRVVYLLGLTKSSRIARQIVSHGHILVNGRKVTIPSYRVSVGDIISVRPESKLMKIFEDAPLKIKTFGPPSWLKADASEFKGSCTGKPEFNKKQFSFDLDLVGRFFSR